jgi:hypothetical protein
MPQSIFFRFLVPYYIYNEISQVHIGLISIPLGKVWQGLFEDNMRAEHNKSNNQKMPFH